MRAVKRIHPIYLLIALNILLIMSNVIMIRVRAFADEAEGRRRIVYEYTERVKHQELLPCEPPMAVFVEDKVVVGFLHGELPDEERRFGFEPAAWTQSSECAFLSHD